MMKRIIPVLVFLLVPLAVLAVNLPQLPTTSASPSLSIREALEIAERYVKDHTINLPEQYIGSAVLLFDAESRKQLYWHIQWRWSMPRIGGEYGLRVYMDGSVEEARLGP